MNTQPHTVNGIVARSFLATVIVVSTVVAALALWELRVLVALLFLGFIVAAAMRPGVDALARHRVPRSVGVLIHYLALGLLLALVLSFVVPTSLHQIQAAAGDIPTTRGELNSAVQHSTGVKHEILISIQRRLERAPTLSDVGRQALNVTRTGLEIIAGIFFVFAVGAYWIFERERAQGVVVSLLPQSKRKLVRQTWQLVDLKLGAYVRGVLLLIMFVSTVLSVSFWAIGLPYWLLLGIFAGVVEIIPVIGPFTAAAVAVGVGFTVSVHTAVLAACVVFGLRLLQDYVINPRVLGHAVGITPLTVLVAVSAAAFLLGPAWVPLATPFAALVATLIDVFVRDRDPAREEVPTVLFPSQEVEPDRPRSKSA